MKKTQIMRLINPCKGMTFFEKFIVFTIKKVIPHINYPMNIATIILWYMIPIS
jgi:hypothetical protein